MPKRLMCAGLNKQKKIAKTFQRKLLNAFFPVLYEFVKFAAVRLVYGLADCG